MWTDRAHFWDYRSAVTPRFENVQQCDFLEWAGASCVCRLISSQKPYQSYAMDNREVCGKAYFIQHAREHQMRSVKHQGAALVISFAQRYLAFTALILPQRLTAVKLYTRFVI
jgi:hypothetical protein